MGTYTITADSAPIGDADVGSFALVTDTGFIVGGASSIRFTGGATTSIIRGTVGGGTNGIAVGDSVGGGADTGGNNTISVAASGGVHGLTFGILAYGSNNTIVNAGTISASIPAIIFAPTGILISGASNTIINTGVITGDFGIVAGADEANSGGRITNSGTISGDVTAIGTSDLWEIVNTGTITGRGGSAAIIVEDNCVIDNGGVIRGGFGVQFNGSSRLINSGEIFSSGSSRFAVFGDAGTQEVTNAGLIDGDVVLADGLDLVNNLEGGTINGTVSMGAGSSPLFDFVTNRGTITQSVTFGDGTDFFTNFATGNVGAVVMNGGNDSFDNTGRINSNVFLGTGSDTLTNAGFIGGDADLGTSTTTDSVENSGTILGSVLMNSTTASTLINHGSGIIGAVNMGTGTGANTLQNLGLVRGNVQTGNGDDTVTNIDGVIAGTVSLGSGNDIFTGGASRERVSDGLGNDVIALEGGDDTYLISPAFTGDNGNDEIEGGAGSDTIDARLLISGVTIDLDDEFATGLRIANDAIFGFENVIGSNFTDTITGSATENRLVGGNGNDTLTGLAGNDRLLGGLNRDLLTGGAGRDILSGGTGNFIDTFDFNATSESGVTAATRDVITDFISSGASNDIINLLTIDADTTLAGNQGFNFIGGNVAFTSTAGELRYTTSGANTLVEADTTGDGRADFAIMVRGLHTLDAGDFVL
ncbi:MAG: beta strand repeat-containing protein [Hyphomicrobium sp.]